MCFVGSEGKTYYAELGRNFTLKNREGKINMKGSIINFSILCLELSLMVEFLIYLYYRLVVSDSVCSWIYKQALPKLQTSADNNIRIVTFPWDNSDTRKIIIHALIKAHNGSYRGRVSYKDARLAEHVLKSMTYLGN